MKKSAKLEEIIKGSAAKMKGMDNYFHPEVENGYPEAYKPTGVLLLGYTELVCFISGSLCLGFALGLMR